MREKISRDMFQKPTLTSGWRMKNLVKKEAEAAIKRLWPELSYILSDIGWWQNGWRRTVNSGYRWKVGSAGCDVLDVVDYGKGRFTN